MKNDLYHYIEIMDGVRSGGDSGGVEASCGVFVNAIALVVSPQPTIISLYFKKYTGIKAT
ncbi:MAG: hypothetical protein KME23_07350 [Goleter apudmare HA4340-LM2]|jgi:hypothetical protein|nr:hypothetical protein [Goleter apudmare HA4340-LM2]